MIKITAADFKKAVDMDPAWASKLTEPVEVTDYCDMRESNITHLSPLLHFTGRDDRGKCGSFFGCRHLKVAEGTFDGYISFSYSSIEKIGDLIITQSDQNCNAASFCSCKNLKVAEGTFHGCVDFSSNRLAFLQWQDPDLYADVWWEKDLPVDPSDKAFGIEKIGDLIIFNTNTGYDIASFSGCKNLKVAEGNFPGSVDFSETGIEQIGNLNITQLNYYGRAAVFVRCKNLTVAEGTFSGHVDFRGSGIEKIGDLTIIQPDDGGEYAYWYETPLAESSAQSIVHHLWKNKSILELRVIQSMLDEYESAVKAAIDTVIQQRLAVMEKQNRAVEIEID